MSNETSIVVVDDEPSIRELLVASLHFAGYEVETAASGSEAIEVIERTQPDLIILDVMPHAASARKASTRRYSSSRRATTPKTRSWA